MLRIKRVGPVMAYVGDLNRAVHFYQKILGFSLIRKTDHSAEFDVKGVVLVVHPPPENLGEIPKGPRLFFEVEDVDETSRHLKSLDVKFFSEPQDYPEDKMRAAIFSDPDGNLFCIWSKWRSWKLPET